MVMVALPTLAVATPLGFPNVYPRPCIWVYWGGLGAERAPAGGPLGAARSAASGGAEGADSGVALATLGLLARARARAQDRGFSSSFLYFPFTFLQFEGK